MTDTGITTVEIRICRVIDQAGRMSVHTYLPVNPNVTELLGMLEMAKRDVYQTIEERRMRDE